MIEHNLDVIKTAEWVIDLGPEGTPERVAANPEGHTGRYLAPVLIGGCASLIHPTRRLHP
ncbi:MAG: hypothetical protein PHD37_07440 [Gallionellaceae bacterium]|nr:hypothetical protein [Gallionellaceae bacterium]